MSELTLTDFLLARIAEDEAVAREARDSFNSLDWAGEHDLPSVGMAASDGPTGEIVVIANPARVLADSDAKRQIAQRHAQEGGVEQWMDADWVGDMSPAERAGYCSWCTYDNRTVAYPCPDLRALALPYADHPDYREEWKICPPVVG